MIDYFGSLKKHCRKNLSTVYINRLKKKILEWQSRVSHKLLLTFHSFNTVLYFDLFNSFYCF